jgi:uncharacterized protein (TIGR00661 family)
LIKKKRILIAPLDWGLGHATRCIPIIHTLLENGAEVLIGADKRPLDLLKNEFPQLEFFTLNGYNVTYPENENMILKMFVQLPKIFKGIIQENRQLEKLITEKKIDAVISDNRYGLWTKKIPCIFITHQLFIKSPFGEKILNYLNRKFISRYTECWIPDTETFDNLSGNLSHGKDIFKNIYFIGPLSRLTGQEKDIKKKYDLLVILSGPEPQRSIFEKIILKELNLSNLKSLVVQGLVEKNESKNLGLNTEVVSHLSAETMNRAIQSSELMVCRSGYSTIMDLSIFNKKVVFVPTPGQTEQEYLAEKFSVDKIAYTVSQDKFNLDEAIHSSSDYSGFKANPISKIKLRERIKCLLLNSRSECFP